MTLPTPELQAEAERLAEDARDYTGECWDFCFYNSQKETEDAITKALQAAYERGVRDGIEQAALEAEKVYQGSSNGLELVCRGFAERIRGVLQTNGGENV